MRALTLHDADALLVVDVQNDFCSNGRLAVPAGEEVVPAVNALMPLFRHVVLTQDWHPAGHLSFASSHPGRAPYETIALSYGPQVLWPDHCVQGTSGAEFHADLARSHAQLIQRKGTDPRIDSYSAFRENDARTVTGLAGWLRERGVQRVFLAGLAFDFCVLWSAEDAHREGFEVVVVEDACRAIDLNGSAAEARHRLDRLDIPRIGLSGIVAPSAA
jgi:nicotinamidase/pyrazinamidase